MHAGGVVIAPSVLTDFAPLYCDDSRRQRRHAVRQGRRRGRGPGEVRLPRPAHAHHHRPGGEDHQSRPRASAASRRWTSARCRWTTRRPTRCCRSLQTTAVFQLESRGMKDLIRRLQPDRFEDIVALVALFRPARCSRAWSMTSSTASTARSTGRSTTCTRASKPVLEAHLRRDPVPGAGDADRAGAGRLHARRRRPAAPRDGQEEARGDGQAALGLRRRRGGARRARAAGRAHLRPDGEVRRLRLQQVALGRLRAAVLPDRAA